MVVGKKVKEKKEKKKNVVVKSSEKSSVEKKSDEKPVGEKKASKVKKSKSEVEAEIKGLDLLKYPLVSEKAVNMIEAENKLTFIVDKRASKPLIKSAVEYLYNVKVKKVNIINDLKSRKKAIVTLSKEFKAGDVATKLGVV